MKHWPTKPLGELCDVEGGNAAPQGDEHFKDGTIPFVRMKDLGRYHLTNNLTETDDKLTESSAAANRMKSFEPGSILFPRSGSVALNHRAILGVRACIVSHIGVLQDLRPEITTDYLYRYLTTFDMTALSKKTTGVDSIPFSDVKRIPIPVPPLTEQKRIVKLLDEADELRKLRSQADRGTAALIPALFREMFGDPSSNTKRWKIVQLGTEVKVQGGYAFKSDDYLKSGVRLVKIANVHFENLSWHEVECLPMAYLHAYASFALRKGDILLALTRPIIKSLNSVKVARVTEADMPCLLNQRVGRFVIRRDDVVDESYLQSFCYTDFFKDSIDSFCSVSLQPNVSTEQVESIPVMLPPLPLQKKFAHRVTEIRALGAAQATSRARLDALFQSILHRAFAGEL